jgi:chromosomal replication initiation ATPase DnaA
MQISAYAIPGKKFTEALPSTIARVKPDQMVTLIKESVLHFYNFKAEQVFRKCRKRELVLARQVMHYLAKKYTPMSLIAIGQEFPNKTAFDHTSVRHSIQTVINLMETDKTILSQVNTIEFNMGCDKEERMVIVTAAKRILTVMNLPVNPQPAKVITLSEHEKVMSKYL